MEGMEDGLPEVLMGGRRAELRELHALTKAAADRSLLALNGGFLFKAGLEAGRLHFGMIPCIVEGQRTYHHFLKFPRSAGYILLGHIAANGVFSLLFKPESRELSEQDRTGYMQAYVLFARVFISAGYAGPGELDSVTGSMLAVLGFRPGPAETLRDLAAVSLPGNLTGMQ